MNDVSQKRGMELRLINGIAHSEAWFGRWGYKFGRGCFGVTESTYQKAIEAIRSIPLYLLIGNSSSNHHHHDIPTIFSRYQTLSHQSLVTLGDLFQFMLELKSRLPRGGENCTDYSGSGNSSGTGILVEANCRWSPKRIEMATRVIVEALKRAEFKWISRQEVRDAARAYIGDTGLLDFVLKSLGNHIVGNYLVRRSLNPVTKVLEYCLEDITNIFPTHHPQQAGNFVMISNPVPSPTNTIMKDGYRITRAQVMKDMFYVYKYILKDPKPTQASIFSAIPLAARIILDTKFLVKDYFGELPFQVDLGLEGKLSLYCTITLRNVYNNNDPNKALIMPPYECITLKSNATVNDLKLEVERNFREIYWGLGSFSVDSIKSLEIASGNDLVFGMVEVGTKLVLEGWINSNNFGEICEGNHHEVNNNNNNNGTIISTVVDCSCGTKEDDGERMVCCDICETWQHTRCVRIPNDEDVPSIFLCKRCEQEIVMFPSLP